MHQRKIQSTSVSVTELGFEEPRGVDTEGGTSAGTSALDDVLPAARELGKSVVAVGVFNSGLLSEDRPVRARDRPARHRDRRPAHAPQYHQRHPRHADPGTGRTNVELHDQRVPDGLWDDLRAQGLIRSDVLMEHGGRDARCL